MQRRRFTKAQLKQLFSDLRKKQITDGMMHALLDETYNQPVTMRTSGFYVPGGNDAQLIWNDSTRTLTLTPVDPGEEVYDANGNLYVPHFRFYTWDRGSVLQRHYAYDAESELPNPDELQLPNEEGLFAVYYHLNDERRRYELTALKNPTFEETAELYISGVLVAWIYWNATAGEALYVGDSRHGSEWNPQMHWMLHQTINSQRQSGLGLTNVTYDGDGSENADYQFGISAGELWHDDIFAAADAVGVGDGLPVWYFDAAGLPRFENAGPGKKFLNTGTGRVAFNSSGLSEATTDYYVLYHLFATNCLLHKIISVMGQFEYEKPENAVAAIENEIQAVRQLLPHSNLMHIETIIIQTSDDYTNDAKGILINSDLNAGKLLPRSDEIDLTAGINNVLFNCPFPSGETYIVWLYSYTEDGYQTWHRLIPESQNYKGFSIEVKKNCRLKYIAALKK